jgi:hypothetical protein
MKRPCSHSEQEPQQAEHEVSLTRNNRRNRLLLI